MSETIKAGPGNNYREVSGTADTPHPSAAQAQAQPAAPFTPPDTSQMGYGAQAGGTAGPQGNGGGTLAKLISTAGKVIDLLPEAAAAA